MIRFYTIASSERTLGKCVGDDLLLSHYILANANV